MEIGAILAIAGQYGVPTGISIYLIWWLTKRFEIMLIEIKNSHKESMIGVKKAITIQTNTLNHTLTKLINNIDAGIVIAKANKGMLISLKKKRQKQ